MKKYRKKPVVVEAIRLEYDSFQECLNFIGEQNIESNNFGKFNRCSCEICFIKIKTLEGVMCANEGDWIVRGVNGEFYPVKNDIFEKTYEEVL